MIFSIVLVSFTACNTFFRPSTLTWYGKHHSVWSQSLRLVSKEIKNSKIHEKSTLSSPKFSRQSKGMGMKLSSWFCRIGRLDGLGLCLRRRIWKGLESKARPGRLRGRWRGSRSRRRGGTGNRWHLRRRALGLRRRWVEEGRRGRWWAGRRLERSSLGSVGRGTVFPQDNPKRRSPVLSYFHSSSTILDRLIYDAPFIPAQCHLTIQSPNSPHGPHIRWPSYDVHQKNIKETQTDKGRRKASSKGHDWDRKNIVLLISN